LAFLLIAAEAHEVVDADALLPRIVADRLIADTAFDSDARLHESGALANRSSSRRGQIASPRDDDRELLQEGHLIEHFLL
jgi:hypothetical protein